MICNRFVCAAARFCIFFKLMTLWISTIAAVQGVAYAATQGFVIGAENVSFFAELQSSERWICRTDVGEIGRIKENDSAESASVFIPVDPERFRRKITRRIKLLRVDIAKSGADSKHLRVRLKRQKNIRRELIAAVAECSLLRQDKLLPDTTPAVSPSSTATPIGTEAATDSPTLTPTVQATWTPSPTPLPTVTPTPTPVGWIANPYYTSPTWKIWGEDDSTAAYNNETYDLPIGEGDRLYPNAAAVTPWPGQFLATHKVRGDEAGFWDDGYKSEDDAHTMIRTSWSSGAASINLSGQFLRLNIGDFGENPAANRALGINFTSQSTTCMGHNLVEGSNISYNERWYYFASTLRGGPSYYSFRDHLPERMIDSYEALPVFGFHSFGRSDSETNGLFKMLVAGGYLPREVKNQLKRSGVYPGALLYIYKASLPYANADGSPVAYDNELRHRVGYLSNGNSTNAEFMPYNQWYHRYDEALHFYEMTQLANSMSVPPPIAVIRFVEGVRVAVDGTRSNFTYNNEAGLTVVKSLLREGEMVEMTVDVGESYDLSGLPLTYRWTVLYPEQKNVSIRHEGGTLYTISAYHNHLLPKGRIPVLLTVSNGVYESNPAVVSFFPPNNCSCSSYQLGATPENEVNVNLRPLFSSSAGGDITVSAGTTASFTLSCTDPEGFATRYYRWLGERGTLTGDQVLVPTTAADSGKTIPLRFICSDGTGGYNSLEQRVIVQ